MKRLLCMAASLCLMLGLSTCTQPPEAPAPDYPAEMTAAAARGDWAAGLEAEALYREQEGNSSLRFSELLLLARYLEQEAGERWLSEDYRLCVGEVLLNRVASPEFPDSLAGVLEELGLYQQLLTASTAPGEQAAALALRLLQGERLLAPQVVHRRDVPSGSVYATFCDRRLHFTYFCESDYPRFYHLSAIKNSPGY